MQDLINFISNLEASLSHIDVHDKLLEQSGLDIVDSESIALAKEICKIIKEKAVEVGGVA